MNMNDNKVTLVVVSDTEEESYIPAPLEFEQRTEPANIMEPTIHPIHYKTSLRDGNCLFNSAESFLHFELISEKLNKKDQERRAYLLRQNVVSYLYEHREDSYNGLPFELLMLDEDEENVNEYLLDMSDSGTWGGQLEIIAIANLLQRTVKVYEQKIINRKRKYVEIFGSSCEIDNGKRPIMLFYRGQSHYDYFVQLPEE